MDQGYRVASSRQHNEHPSVSHPRPNLLLHPGRLQAPAALQVHRRWSLPPSWLAPEPEAILIWCPHSGDEKEGFLDSLHSRLVGRPGCWMLAPIGALFPFPPHLLTATISFSAAALGLPKLLREEDVQAEYPSDMDDEYITEKGFQPTLPGEYTRLSSALALFRGSRILARVLERIYPASANYDLSLHLMATLEGELDAWHAELPAHLRLNFIQDKPSPDVTSSRSPLIVSGARPSNLGIGLELTGVFHFLCPIWNLSTGLGVLLHPHPYLPPCCGVGSRAQGGASTALHRGI